MRTTLMPIAVMLALAVGACGSDEQTASPAAGSTEAQALQDRVEKLESEAKQQEAEAARKVRAAERKAKAAERRALRAKRVAKRKREQAREKAAQAEVVAAEESGGGIVVPDVVGLDHQAAQDALQGEGLWMLDEEDCTGQGRMLLFDRNWEVVSTDPPAGTHVSEDTTITLCSQKQGE
jgi:hypothetical protein